MDRAEAWSVLGVSPTASADELRSAYRQRLFALHPDHSGQTGEGVRTVISAYRVLASQLVASPDLVPVQSTALADDLPADELPADDLHADEVLADDVWLIGPDTIALAMPADDAYLRLLEVAHRIGDVTYVDRSCALMEALLRTKDGTTLSLVISLQGRALGHTEAFLTIEPVDLVRGPLPNVADLTQLVASHLH